MTLRSPIGRARGLGSAKSGMGHHWSTIVTAVGLIPLSLWFVVSIARLAGADHAAFSAWIGQGSNAALMILTIGLVCYHASLGLSMVIEDYVSCKAKKFAGLLATRLIAALLAVGMTVSILKIAVGG
ncbi:MAG: succinate dehydrogenase, hydrophobic membrane anchor protein [Magnetospirillum gryphiswaldense]|uniref:succinate dehydrogenase, hydrophobic membrane anchor protein n=1 Tax=Magnetospirillum sp. 64-120 TaxID=1895778 RepID=UPI0009269C5F|nr:succinate dehydrogenase, hydrophobic membrane anchor protein [Magnetospirillum sp. 64-120]MBI2242199.1 succinate dehydrogenase, hydrophobic membrane anchor protein [Magnetospirillum gryphiswaldense]OJX70417.1 MAG: succinate dehydrogenase, hydrophobic membrane anchor protein [Magnetospirillum sp. 64-120]